VAKGQQRGLINELIYLQALATRRKIPDEWLTRLCELSMTDLVYCYRHLCFDERLILEINRRLMIHAYPGLLEYEIVSVPQS